MDQRDMGKDRYIPTHAPIDHGLPENDQRQDYLRSTLSVDDNGSMTVEPARKQDSSMIGIYAHANALIVRPPFDPPKSAGDAVMVMRLDPLL